MKKHLSQLKTAVTFLLVLVTLHGRAAEDPAVEKRKTFSKSYSVSGSDKISIDNQFGEMRVTTWNKNEVKVDVTIISKSTTDQRAQQILDRISIEDGKNSDGVFFKTKIGKSEKNKDDGKNYKEEKMEINYVVSMPSGNPLDLDNQFGAMIVPDLGGTVQLSSKFGSLTAGKLAKVKAINVEFGSARLESVNSGTLTIKFSTAVVDKLDGSVIAMFEHCSGVKLGIQNSTRDVSIQNNFTKLYLDVNTNISADFQINTNFGELSNKSGFDIKEEVSENSHGPKFKHRYTGKSGSGGTSMRIQAEFSNIVLGHNLTMDAKEKKTTTSN